MNVTNNNFDSRNIFKAIWKYKITIATVLAVAGICAAVFSGPAFITPLYKSTVILYPTSSNSVSKALISTTYSAKNDIMEFGEDEQTEQMLQILNSNRVKDKVIAKFDLINHYKIKTTEKYPFTKLEKEYQSKIKFSRTEYGAVRISVRDSDPIVAANIANEIAEIYDSTVNALQKEVAIKAFMEVEAVYNGMCEEMQAMEDSLNVLRSYGVLDYEKQVEMLSQQLAVELGKINQKGVDAIQKKLDVLAQYGGAFYSINERLDYDRQQLSLVKTKYEEARMDATQNIPHKFIVTNALPSERKDYPVRWLIVAITLCATALLLFFLLLFVDSAKNEAATTDSENHNKPIIK